MDGTLDQRSILLWLLFLVAAAFTPPVGARTTGAEAAGHRNNWSGFPTGSWIDYERSERWGSREPRIEVRRTVLTEQRGAGTAVTEIRERRDDNWHRLSGELLGAYAPETAGSGMRRISEQPAGVELSGAGADCTVTEYAGVETDGATRHLMLWRCPEVELAYRVLPQWRRSFGWQLDPQVVRARIERRDPEGGVRAVELQVERLDGALAVGERTVRVFEETVVWHQRMAGADKSRVTGETRRWLSREVPGLLVRSESHDSMRRVTTTRVTAFGAAGE